MKRFLKVLVNLLAVIMLATTCMGLVGCYEDIRRVELTVQVYNYDASGYYDQEETKLTVKFFRHLAPKTVDTMLSYIKDGYYDNAIFYTPKSELNRVMMGDLAMNDDGEIVQKEIMPTIEGEFKHGGTIGSNLGVINGNIGLWRTWKASDGTYKTSADAHTGRATWFIPTKELSGYQDWFCMFAVIDVNDQANAITWDRIKDACMKDANTEEYTVYYTGTYDKNSGENNGLTFNCERKDNVNLSSVKDLFSAKDDQYVCYNSYNILVSQNVCKIVSAKVL